MDGTYFLTNQFFFLWCSPNKKIRMENPFELIMYKLTEIEKLIKQKNGITIGTEEILNLEMASAYVGISKSTIYKYTSTKEIPHFKRGKRLFFKKVELDDWLTAHKVSSRDEIDKMATEYILKNKRKY
jgi:excisionase family DNA binding protein